MELSEMPLAVQASALERFFHLDPLRFQRSRVVRLRYFHVPPPADRHSRKRLGNKKPIPRPQLPGLLGMSIENADVIAGNLGQLDRPGLRLIDRPTRTIRGKDRRVPSLHRLGERKQPT